MCGADTSGDSECVVQRQVLTVTVLSGPSVTPPTSCYVYTHLVPHSEESPRQLRVLDSRGSR